MGIRKVRTSMGSVGNSHPVVGSRARRLVDVATYFEFDIVRELTEEEMKTTYPDNFIHGCARLLHTQMEQFPNDRIHWFEIEYEVPEGPECQDTHSDMVNLIPKTRIH